MAFAKDLRASVLQAAMQGKLTEQLETDTPVSELLNKMNIKSKYNEDGVAPDSWQWVEMQDIVKLEKGEKTENKKLPYLEARYLRTGNDAKMYTSGEFVAKGTNVILVDGENSGEVFLVPEDGYMGSTFKVLSINSEMDKDFILKILLFYKDMFRQSKKGSAIPHLNKKLFKELMVAVPPIEEQKRVVRRIEEIMIRINELEAIEEELKKLKEVFPADMKAAVLQAAIQGKLTEQLETDSSVDELLDNIKTEREQLVKEGKIKKSKTQQNSNFVELNEAPFDIPSSWRWVKWGDIAENIQYGYNGAAKESGKIKMVRISDISNNGVNYETVPYCDIKTENVETYLLKPNDILFARTGGTVGKSFLVKDVPPNTIYAGYLIRTRYNSKLNPQYLKYFMESELYWEQLKNGTTQNCQPNCNGQTLSKMKLPLPPIEEQQRIVNKLETILPLIEDI